jgi:hypothetical protein
MATAQAVRRPRQTIINMAIPLPIAIIKGPMSVSLNILTTDQLETVRSNFNWLSLIATVGVWVGVSLEGKRFSTSINEIGWNLLIFALAAETYCAFALIGINSIVEARQKYEITSLEKQIAPRRLLPDQQDLIKGRVFDNSGKTVLVESYALDAESAVLGKQLESALLPELQVEDGLMQDSITGTITFGVHVTGPDKKLVALLLSAFNDAGFPATGEPPATTGSGFHVVPNGHIDATVFVGVKPITE